MKISIAMATYNGEKYLLEQLQSIINQTYEINEIIIIDDCSTDKTVHIAENFLSEFPQEKKIIVNKKNLGTYKNFEKALMHCTGDIIFLSDQDDIWLPNKIETHIKLHEIKKNIQIFTNDCSLTDDLHHTFGVTKMKNLESAGINLTSMIMGCCCSIKKGFLKKALPFPPNFKGHDNWLCFLADKNDERLLLSDDLQFYRQHGSNTSNYFVNNEKGLRIHQKIIGSIKRIFKRLNSSNKIKNLALSSKEIIRNSKSANEKS